MLVRDVVSVGSLGILLLFIHEFGQPFIRGFNCNDETIRYPYKDSTVSSGVCYFIGSGINVALILAVEYMNLISARQQANDAAASMDNSTIFSSRAYIRNVYCRLIIWFFGAIMSELLTDISKITAGRLRPHFISVCRPVIDRLEFTEFCSKTSKPYEYITNYTCTGIHSKQRDARLSFLSGHSSYSSYSATFAILYLQSSLDMNKFGLLKPSLQVLIAAAAFYTGLTRVSDYKHHWQDVLAGLLLGTTVASFVSTFVWPSFYKTYTSVLLNKSTNNKQAETDEATTAAELNRLDH